MENIGKAKAEKFSTGPVIPPKPKLLDQVRQAIRSRHYSIRTEEAYVAWVRRFILFHGKRHPKEMGRPEIELFLSDLAVQGQVAASTQNQALNALVFLYREIIKQPFDEIDCTRAKRPQKLPVVLTKDETRRLLNALDGTNRLLARLLYGTGMRLMEAIRLRVKDVDFEKHQIIIRDGKGMKDRITMLPDTLAPDLASHLQRVKQLHEADLKKGFPEGFLFGAPALLLQTKPPTHIRPPIRVVCHAIQQHF